MKGHPEFEPSQPTELGPEFLEDLPDFMKNVTIFREQHTSLLQACKTYAQTPSDETWLAVSAVAVRTTEVLDEALTGVIKAEMTDSEQIQLMADLLLEEDRLHNEYFQELTGSEFPILSETPKRQEKFFRKFGKRANKLDNLEQVKSFAVNCFAGNLSFDLNRLAAVVNGATGDQQQTEADSLLDEQVTLSQMNESEITNFFGNYNRHEVAKELGKRVLDITTIASGVALGIWAARRK